jgi:ribosomal protein S18 acetylase RimI-like enzyme
MIIRRLSPDDVTEYRNLRLTCIEENPAAVSASYAEEVAVPLDQMRQRLLHNPYQAIFGAFASGNLVAMAGFRRESIVKTHHRGDIWGVYVAPTARGTGVSRKLLVALLDYVRTIPDVILVNLCVRTTNDAAKALYRRLGFIVTGIDRRSIFADGVYHDEERMVLNLDAA